VALLYGLGLTGLQVNILGPLYYAALSHLHPLMEDCQCTGQSCVLILLTCLFVCIIPRGIGGTSSATPSDSSVCI
jgi:hypothetical protein